MRCDDTNTRHPVTLVTFISPFEGNEGNHLARISTIPFTKEHQMTKKKKEITPAPAKRPPTEREAKVLQRGAAKWEQRLKPVEVEIAQSGHLSAPHTDELGFLLALADTLGTASLEYMKASMQDIERITRPYGVAGGEGGNLPINAAIALIEGIRPENELEGALAQQMVGIHALAIEMTARAKLSDRIDHAQLYGNMAAKLSRTFTAQIEALGKMRRGGEQIVRHIHVDNRGGQAIIAETLTTGVQENDKTIEQSCGQHLQSPPLAALLGKDTAGDFVPMPCYEGQEAVQNTRRRE